MMVRVYSEFSPPPALRSVARCLWQNSAGNRPVAEPRRWILPDGCLDLIVGGGRVFVAGPDTRAWRSELPPGTVLHGLRFHPGHAPRALGLPADELLNQRVDLADLWGARGRQLTGRLLESPGELCAVVAAGLETPPDHLVDLVRTRLDGGVSRVAEALDGVEVGQRQLRRRFSAAVGYGPATYLRVARLRRAIELAGRVPDLASLAAESGYADQAHLTRDWRDLTGFTPGRYFDVRSVQSGPAPANLRSTA